MAAVTRTAVDSKAEPTYVSLAIEQTPDTAELSENLLAVLAQVVNRSPEAVRQQLQGGTLKLAKVLVNRDLKKLMTALQNSGLSVVAQPLQEDKKGDPTSTEKNSLSGLSLPNRGEIDLNWKTGEIVEGIYEVLGSAQGGMGKVYFVFHRLWKMNLAIKTPHSIAIQSETNILRFLREAELWVDLGLHPNIATCYYARVIKGIPRL